MMSEEFEEVEEIDEFDPEEDLIIRAKWIMDGARTLDEAITKVEEFADYLRELKQQGWQLIAPIEDDYGFLRRPDQEN